MISRGGGTGPRACAAVGEIVTAMVLFQWHRSSTAMVLNTRGVNVNPASLNSWLDSNGGYESGCDIVW